MIKLINRYRLAIVITLLVVISIIIRNTGPGRFRYDARRWAEPSVSGSNIVTPESALLLKGDILIIELDKANTFNKGSRLEVIKMNPDSVLSASGRKALTGNKGPVLLYSMNQGLSAKIWMILSQTGFKNIYILSRDTENEIIKEKFRPDSIDRPEFQNIP
jgi:hypothetical protein